MIGFITWNYANVNRNKYLRDPGFLVWLFVLEVLLFLFVVGFSFINGMRFVSVDNGYIILMGMAFWFLDIVNLQNLIYDCYVSSLFDREILLNPKLFGWI